MAKSEELVSTNSVVALQDSSSPEGLNELEGILLRNEPIKMEVITDPDQISREIAQRILSADTDEMPEATGWDKYTGIPVEIHGFRWSRSQFEEGPPVFMIVDAVNMQDGSRILLTTGSYNVLCQLVNIAKRNAFPAIRMLKVSDKASRSGFFPQRLVSVTQEQQSLADAMSSDEIPF